MVRENFNQDREIKPVLFDQSNKTGTTWPFHEFWMEQSQKQMITANPENKSTFHFCSFQYLLDIIVKQNDVSFIYRYIKKGIVLDGAASRQKVNMNQKAN